MAAVAALCGATFAGLATADPVRDPGELADTAYTPVPKETGAKDLGWRQIGGAIFDSEAARDEARAMGYKDTGQIPHTVDFYTVSFFAANRGLAAGAKCEEAVPDDQLDTCSRVPVVYEYASPTPNQPPEWREVTLPDGGQTGYVGAVAWISAEKAVAVGGSGCYPRREVVPKLDPAERADLARCVDEAVAPDTGREHRKKDQVAGDARAWVLERGEWRSISDQLPPTMTGLTALAFSERLGDCRGASFECGLAGGLGQIWTWRDDGFVAVADTNVQAPYLTSTNPNDKPATTAIPPFRVRGIVFQAGTTPPQPAVAVTSGCCWEDLSTPARLRDSDVNYPRLMLYQRSGRRWNVREVVTSPTPTPRRTRTLPDSLYAVNIAANCASVVAATGSPPPGDLPDPADPLSSVQPASRVIGATCEAALKPALDGAPGGGSQGPTGSETVADWPELSSVRLVAGDDSGGTHARNIGHKITGYPGLQSPRTVDGSRPDGYLDWAVGEWSSNGQALGYTTALRTYGLDAPHPLSCQNDPLLPPGPTVPPIYVNPQCKADLEFTEQAASDNVFLLPSYPLNGLDAIGNTGTFWAVGDRGAVLRLGSGDAATKDAGAGDPPKLGAGAEARLSSREAYDAFRPAISDDAGVVPPLLSRPTTPVSGWDVSSWGSPNPDGGGSVHDLVMSRDGTEGWAVGPHRDNDSSRRMALYRFDGTRWSNCETRPVDHGIDGDPACSGLDELRQRGPLGAQFVALARVPTENGRDASKGADFEVVAIARDRDDAGFLVAHYRAGTWTLRRDWSSQLRDIPADSTSMELAFGGPDDGWLVVNPPASNQTARLFRFSEDRWQECRSATDAPVCLDAGGVVGATLKNAAPPDTRQTRVRGLRLTSVGSRVYLYGTQRQPLPETLLTQAARVVFDGVYFPVIVSVDVRDDAPEWRREYDPMNDPACEGGCAAEQGVLNALSLARPTGGSDEDDTGWGIGYFGEGAGTKSDLPPVSQEGVTPVLRLEDPAKRRWMQMRDPGRAALAYLLPQKVAEAHESLNTEVQALPADNGTGAAVAVQYTLAGVGIQPQHPMVWFNPGTRRWEAFPTPFTMSKGHTHVSQSAMVSAIRSDARGGFWFVAEPSQAGQSWFYRAERHARSPVFSEAPHPVREIISAAAAGGDGSFWVATESGTVYRSDRLTGWDRVPIKGWDAAGVVQSPAHGIAIGPDGKGFVVGKSGRIAEIGPRGVSLEPSALLCSSDPGKCETKRTLRSVAVASDGSALAGGDSRTLLWRAPNGRFTAIAGPDLSGTSTITSISMPTPSQAWFVTSTGDLFAGTLSGGRWNWTREAVDPSGRSMARDAAGVSLRLEGVAVDASGRGYAVGSDGLILERVGQGAAWRRIGGYLADLRSVTLGPGGRGALIGGSGGLILTRVSDRFEVARHGDFFDPLVHTGNVAVGPVISVALLAGHEPGQVEAWAVTQPSLGTLSHRRPTPGAVLHYTSDPGDPLLAGGAGRARPLPDAPARVEGELALAAFGKSECQGDSATQVCPELHGTKLTNDLTAQRVRDALIKDESRPDLALFTGDANDIAGSRDSDTASLPVSPSVMHERWWESVGAPLGRAGIPVYGALGGQDLSHTRACNPLDGNFCAGTRTLRQKASLNLAWRQALIDAPFPWGRGPVHSASGLSVREVRAVGVDPRADPLNGARTHYALDVRRDGKKVLRLVVLDTSLKSASGVAALQNPVREQLAWLDDVLRRNRDPGQPALVVSETPSYAYEPRAGAATDTLVDSAAFETILVKNRVTAVVSGRLGWNGLYWLVAPGLHSPCPGGSYRADPPKDASQLCQSGEGPTGAGDRLAGQLEERLGQPVPRPSEALQKVAGGLANIPVAVAASAGGNFGPNGEGGGSGSQGFWRGFTRIRVFPGTNLTPVIEQRPVFDWIGIHASEHTLTPGRRLALRGYGREPLGLDMPARYVDIDGPAITHRYDLVLADPDKPYLPKVDPTSEYPNHYVSVPDEIRATIDPQTGVVRYNGRGNHPPVYALAILSVDKQAATWPIVFAPRRSFKAPPPPRGDRIVLPPPARPLGTPLATLPPTPTSPVPQPPNISFTFPPPPGLPTLPLSSPQTQPPPPPPPPPPPVSPAGSALQITPTPVGLNVAPAATVIPPPAPPIQPAPPGGARREARQRQAAAAKSEEGADKGQEAGGGSEGAHSATRHDLPRDLAFSARSDAVQQSAWTRNLAYGGGLGVAALVLALGYGLVRPGPRRRAPELPAPAWARSHRPRRLL